MENDTFTAMMLLGTNLGNKHKQATYKYTNQITTYVFSELKIFSKVTLIQNIPRLVLIISKSNNPHVTATFRKPFTGSPQVTIEI